MIKLSKRLQVVASFVPDKTTVIDVGCDHAYLAIYLQQTLTNIKIYASDINRKPLEIAKENLQKYQMVDKIKLLQADGIKTLPKDIDTIVIAGMGGILISNILSEKNKLFQIKNIIVSPNNDFEIVRETLVKNNFKIVKEELVIDSQKTYLVLKAIPGKSKKIDYFFGTLKNDNLETIYYYTNILNTNSKILKQLPARYFLKKLKLQKENKKIKKFLNNKKIV